MISLRMGKDFDAVKAKMLLDIVVTDMPKVRIY